jgi:hypothetical protein
LAQGLWAAAPPLVVSAEQVGESVAAIRELVEFAHHPGPSGRKRWDWRGGRWAREKVAAPFVGEDYEAVRIGIASKSLW